MRHFSVEGTLIEAWASQKSFQRKDRGPTPRPRTPEARLARKSGGHESKLAYCGSVLIENRNGLGVDTELVLCSGTAEA